MSFVVEVAFYYAVINKDIPCRGVRKRGSWRFDVKHGQRISIEEIREIVKTKEIFEGGIFIEIEDIFFYNYSNSLI